MRKIEQKYKINKSCTEKEFIFLGCSSDSTPKQIIPSVVPLKLINLSLPQRKVNNKGVLLLFTGEINGLITNLNTTTTNLILNFRIIKTCDNITKQISPTFTFTSRSFTTPETFSYQFCDCSPCCCNNCIDYLVEFIPATISNLESITVRNVVLSARSISCCAGKEDYD